MAKKINSKGKRRCLRKVTVSEMLTWSHYKFRLRLLHKASQYGKTVLIVDESYTSKTCSKCGWQNDKLGGSKTFKCKNCEITIDRDHNAARNILLKNTY